MNRIISPSCRVLVITGVLTCIATSAAAQQGRVRGVVRDDERNGIEGATVTA